MKLRDALHDIGIEIVAERRLPSGKHQITYRHKGKRGSVLVDPTATAFEVFELLYTKFAEHTAEAAGLDRQAGRDVAAAMLADARAEGKHD